MNYCHVHDPSGVYRTQVTSRQAIAPVTVEKLPDHPALARAFACAVARIERLERNETRMTALIDDLRKEIANLRTGDEWKNTPANDDCPFTPNT